MSESANLMPFVCKWLDTHSDPQHFKTKENLEIISFNITSVLAKDHFEETQFIYVRGKVAINVKVVLLN